LRGQGDPLLDAQFTSVLFQLAVPQKEEDGDGDGDGGTAGSLALLLIGDIVNYRCVPVTGAAEQFLMECAGQLLQILQQANTMLADLPESYCEQLGSLLVLFFHRHLRRLEALADYPLQAVLQHLLHFSMAQPHGLVLMTHVLQLWDNFAERAKSCEGHEPVFGLLVGALTCEAQQLMQQVQWSANEEVLDQFDDDANANQDGAGARAGGGAGDDMGEELYQTVALLNPLPSNDLLLTLCVFVVLGSLTCSCLSWSNSTACAVVC
jgi:hypothetical protein